MFEHDNGTTRPLMSHEDNSNDLGFELINLALAECIDGASESPMAKKVRIIAGDFEYLTGALSGFSHNNRNVGNLGTEESCDTLDPIEYQIAQQEGGLGAKSKKMSGDAISSGMYIRRERVSPPDPITFTTLKEERKGIIRKCRNLTEIFQSFKDVPATYFDDEKRYFAALLQTASPETRESFFAACGEILQNNNASDISNIGVKSVIDGVIDDSYFEQKLIGLGIETNGKDARQLRIDIIDIFGGFMPTDEELCRYFGHLPSVKMRKSRIPGLKIVNAARLKIGEALASMRAPKKLTISTTAESVPQKQVSMAEELPTAQTVESRFHPEAVSQIDDLGGFVLEFMQFLENHGCQRETFFTAIVGLLPYLDESGTSHKDYFVKSCYLPALDFLSTRSSAQEISEAA